MVNVYRRGSTDEAFLRDPFEVVSIRQADPPPGLSGSDWYRYEICQGHNQIIGFRSGDKENVTLAIEDIVCRLNERRQRQRGQKHLVLGSGSVGRSR